MSATTLPEVGTMTRDESVAELRRLADLANDSEHKWTADDEKRWNAVSKRCETFVATREERRMPNVAAPDAGGEGFLASAAYETYRDMRTGRSVPVAKREQSIAGANRHVSDDPERFDGMSLGGVLRALAVGCETDAERRALAEGTDSAGGYTVPTVLSSQLIDLLRKKSRVVQAGAMSLPVDSDRHEFAKLASDPTPGWRAEGAAVAESDPTFTRVVFEPKSLAVQVKVSEELLQDSVNIETALQNSLSNALALEVDRAALFGSGSSNQPLGLFNMPGLQSVSMGTNGAAIADYSNVLDAIQDLQEANAGEVSAAIMAPRTWRQFAGLVDSTGQPLMRPKAIESLAFLETTQVPTDQTQGTANDASTILLGNYSGLVLGFRQRLRIEVLRELYRGNLQVGFLAHLRMDVQAWHEESFAKIVGITP